MLQNARFTAFTVFKLLGENQQRVIITHTQIRVKLRQQIHQTEIKFDSLTLNQNFPKQKNFFLLQMKIHIKWLGENFFHRKVLPLQC